jgi:hypothetical protein
MGLTHWWKTGAAPNDYAFGLAEETLEGQRVAYLRSIVHPARRWLQSPCCRLVGGCCRQGTCTGW